MSPFSKRYPAGSYCYDLQKNVEELEMEIKIINRRSFAADPKTTPETILPGMIDYHLGGSRLLTDSAGAHTAYIGPGSSARMMQHLLKGIVEWHFTHKGPEFETTVTPLFNPSPSIDDHGPRQNFPVTLDHRKIELATTVTPSMQRAMVEHYLKVIQPEYPLLSPDQEASLLEKENPLRWSTTNAAHADGVALTAIFAISAALISRDIDPMLSTISTTYRESLRAVSQQGSTQANIQTLSRSIITACFSVICEIIGPTSNGATWGLLGRALASMVELRAEYRAQSQGLDADFHRLEYSLLKLEGSISIHFRRPSRYCAMRSSVNVLDSSISRGQVDPSVLYTNIRNITESFCTTPLPQQEHFESLIPSDLRASISQAGADITLPAAVIYLTLHPLFTSKGTEIFSDYPLPTTAINLLHTIGRSARKIIDEYFQSSKVNKIISIWMAAERVLEAGAVWATYLIIMKRKQSSTGGLSNIGMNHVMRTLTRCSTLLVSFAERWKEGLVYVEIWEIFLSLLWGVLE
ncbi:uncharacterized protein BP5553_01606 [Venustampulla echinocandica]|uniref:Transcription factor domain-containing protein n=1 Tax=Venustampulla echinocandica TaxID=2656787 RepID=A0A370U1I6_9HELO|nr:uncharacterized protein BP5553_01606 [Venustampulla echinocandica]RDL41627.1 hypothetical protein BP5553_01606 [Venustampulla echinocandica]